MYGQRVLLQNIQSHLVSFSINYQTRQLIKYIHRITGFFQPFLHVLVSGHYVQQKHESSAMTDICWDTAKMHCWHKYMQPCLPGQELHALSTAGIQASELPRGYVPNFALKTVLKRLPNPSLVSAHRYKIQTVVSKENVWRCRGRPTRRAIAVWALCGFQTELELPVTAVLNCHLASPEHLYVVHRVSFCLQSALKKRSGIPLTVELWWKFQSLQPDGWECSTLSDQIWYCKFSRDSVLTVTSYSNSIPSSAIASGFG